MLRISAIDHLVLRVRDIDAMRRFYCDVLGAEHVAWRPELGLSHLRAGASMIDLVLAGEGPRGRNLDHFCLRLEPFDRDAILAQLAAHGVAVGEIARRFGAEGNGTSIYVTDPEGNTVELKGPSDGRRTP